HEIPRRKGGRIAARTHALVAYVGGTGVSEHSSSAARTARSHCATAVAVRVSMWRRTTRSARAAAFLRPARGVVKAPSQRLACDVAGSLDSADRNRRLSGVDRSRVGSASFPLATGGAQAVPAGAHRAPE